MNSIVKTAERTCPACKAVAVDRANRRCQKCGTPLFWGADSCRRGQFYLWLKTTCNQSGWFHCSYFK